MCWVSIFKDLSDPFRVLGLRNWIMLDVFGAAEYQPVEAYIHLVAVVVVEQHNSDMR